MSSSQLDGVSQTAKSPWLVLGTALELLELVQHQERLCDCSGMSTVTAIDEGPSPDHWPGQRD